MSDVYAEATAVDDQQQATRAAGPFTRYWVRTLDLSLCTYVLGATAYLIIKSAGLATSLPEHPFAIMFGLLAATPAALILDALCYAAFGTTLARAPMGTAVITRDGAKLTSAQYFNRNMAMLGPGYAFGLPLFAFVTFVASYNKLRDTGYTSWDAKHGYVVRVKGRLVSNYFVTFVVWFCVQLCMSLTVGVWLALSPLPVRHDRPVPARPPAVSADIPADVGSTSEPLAKLPFTFQESGGNPWVDPYSKKAAPLPDGWYGGTFNPKTLVWAWLHQKPEVFLGLQFWPLDGKSAAPLADYPNALRHNGTAPWALVGPGKIEWENRAVWQGEETVRSPQGYMWEGEMIFSMTRIFEGDGGVWVMTYTTPAATANPADALSVGRALQSATVHW